MRRILMFGLLCLSGNIMADTMDHYMHIANQIPKMEMKADVPSQAWARSARSVLMITNETIAETLIHANAEARAILKKPFFCLPDRVVLDGESIGTLIMKTYQSLSSQQTDKDKLTVSQMAWLAVAKTYPCAVAPNPALAHVTGSV